MSSPDCSSSEEPSWDMMPPDLLGRCFNALPDRERCRVIPLVCRAFRDSHLTHPPQPKSWKAWKVPLTHSRVQWFFRICHQVEHLELTLPDRPPGRKEPGKGSFLLLYMLERAELYMLHKLQLSGVWAPHAPVAQLFGCPPLSRLKELSLEGWPITKDSAAQDFQSLSSLQSLTSLDVEWEGFQNVTEIHANAMWEALATLKDLRSLSLRPSKKIISWSRVTTLAYGSKPFFFGGLDSVSQISQLSIIDAEVCLYEDDYVHPAFERMTRLTGLSLTGECAHFKFEPVSVLTQLERLKLVADDQEHIRKFGEMVGPPMDLGPLCRLTDLCLVRCTGWELQEILPATLPALRNLKGLALCNMDLEYFPPTICKALERLTLLDLSYNSFEHFPREVEGIKSLVQLDIGGNSDLRMTDDDVYMLERMHQCGLKSLKTNEMQGFLEPQFGVLSFEAAKKFQRQWCRVIPLVCRAFHDSHLTHPPQPRRWSTEKVLNNGRVQWFLKICRQVVSLSLTIPADGACLLLALLEKAELPDLKSLDISGHWAACVPPLQLFQSMASHTSLREVGLWGWPISEESSVDEYKALSCLLSLTKLCISWTDSFCDITEQQSDAMWAALATLKDLRALNLRPSARSSVHHDIRFGNVPYFLRSISVLTQISVLEMSEAQVCLDDSDLGEGLLHLSLSSLTQLTFLNMNGECSSFGYRPILSLTRLEHLWVHSGDKSFYEEHGGQFDPHLDLSPLCRLTMLGLYGWAGRPIQKILPASMPALANLKHLRLTDMLLTYFPATLCGALRSLTHLDLSSNSFKRLPPGLPCLKALIVLNISCNFELRLSERDLNALSALPCLREIDVEDCYDVFDELPPHISPTAKRVLKCVKGEVPPTS